MEITIEDDAAIEHGNRILKSEMSEAAAQYKRMIDRLDVGNTLDPDDAAALSIALKLSLKYNIPIERGLKWPKNWRIKVRIMNVLLNLFDLRTGENDRADARRILSSTTAMRQLKIARGKESGDRTLRKWLRELRQNYPSRNCPDVEVSYDHDEQNKAESGRRAFSDRR
jgi:hypothetical protein